MKVLLARGADPNTRNLRGETPLHGAARYGRVEAMRILLSHGANADDVDHSGQAPLAMIDNYGTKAVDRRQSKGRGDTVAQRRATMATLLREAQTAS